MQPPDENDHVHVPDQLRGFPESLHRRVERGTPHHVITQRRRYDFASSLHIFFYGLYFRAMEIVLVDTCCTADVFQLSKRNVTILNEEISCK